MKTFFKLTFLISIISSCATTSQVSDLESTLIEQNQQLRVQVQMLQVEITTFKQAYNPALHDKLQQNIQSAQMSKNSILKMQRDLQIEYKDVQILLEQLESETTEKLNSLERLNEQAKTNIELTTSQVIVYEFRRLNEDISQKTIEINNEINEMALLVTESNTSANKSLDAAQEAKILATESERSAYEAKVAAKNIKDFDNELARIVARIDSIKDKQERLGKAIQNLEALE